MTYDYNRPDATAAIVALAHALAEAQCLARSWEVMFNQEQERAEHLQKKVATMADNMRELHEKLLALHEREKKIALIVDDEPGERLPEAVALLHSQYTAERDAATNYAQALQDKLIELRNAPPSPVGVVSDDAMLERFALVLYGSPLNMKTTFADDVRAAFRAALTSAVTVPLASAQTARWIGDDDNTWHERESAVRNSKATIIPLYRGLAQPTREGE